MCESEALVSALPLHYLPKASGSTLLEGQGPSHHFAQQMGMPLTASSFLRNREAKAAPAPSEREMESSGFCPLGSGLWEEMLLWPPVTLADGENPSERQDSEVQVLRTQASGQVLWACFPPSLTLQCPVPVYTSW